MKSPYKKNHSCSRNAHRRQVVAAAGDTVKRGDTLVILEAMKMEIPVVAPEDGQVLSINAAEGDSIETGDTVACLKPQSAGE